MPPAGPPPLPVSLSFAGCLTNLQGQAAQQNFRPLPVTFCNHDAASQERNSGIECADVFMLNGVGNAIAVEQAPNQRQFTHICRFAEAHQRLKILRMIP